MAQRFCLNNHYPRLAEERSDSEIETHLFHYYRAPLRSPQKRDPSYRMWRRLMIVEGLKRGIILKDPGPNGTIEGR